MFGFKNPFRKKVTAVLPEMEFSRVTKKLTREGQTVSADNTIECAFKAGPYSGIWRYPGGIISIDAEQFPIRTTPGNLPRQVFISYTETDTLGGALSLCQGSGVVPHFVIGRDGSVSQLILVNRAAPGKRLYEGTEVSPHSLFVELVGLGPLQKKSDRFYDVCGRVFESGDVLDSKLCGNRFWQSPTKDQEAALTALLKWVNEKLGVRPQDYIRAFPELSTGRVFNA